MKKFVKRAVSLLLLVMMLASMFTISALADGNTYPKYTGNSVSIVDALYAVGASDAEAAYAYRKEIAAANGITDYQGTAEQNELMVKLIKAGELVKPATAPSTSTPSTTPSTTPNTTPSTSVGPYYPKYTGNSVSIVDALYAVGASDAEVTYDHRALIAAANGITGYQGTAEQNELMVYWLKTGQLGKVATSTTTPSGDVG